MARKAKAVTRKQNKIVGPDHIVATVAFMVIGLLIALIAINSPLKTSDRAATGRACGERCAFGNQCESGKCISNKCGGAMCTGAVLQEGKVNVCGECDTNTRDSRFRCESGLQCMQSYLSGGTVFRCKCARYGDTDPNAHPDCKKSFEEIEAAGEKCRLPECPYPSGIVQQPYRCVYP